MEVGEVFNVSGNNLSSSAQFEVWCMPTHVKRLHEKTWFS